MRDDRTEMDGYFLFSLLFAFVCAGGGVPDGVGAGGGNEYER